MHQLSHKHQKLSQQRYREGKVSQNEYRK